MRSQDAWTAVSQTRTARSDEHASAETLDLSFIVRSLATADQPASDSDEPGPGDPLLNSIVDVLLPPTSLAILILLLILAGGRRMKWLAGGLAAALVLLAVPAFSALMLNGIAPPPSEPGLPPEAIVILSADGIQVPGKEDDLEPGLLTLERLRAGAALQRKTKLPVLVTGGRFETKTSLASMMAHSLQNDFGVPVKWEEGSSRDTWENATKSAVILKAAGIKRIYLGRVDGQGKVSRRGFPNRHFIESVGNRY